MYIKKYIHLIFKVNALIFYTKCYVFEIIEIELVNNRIFGKSF